MQQIQNEFLRVCVNEKGGSLTSIFSFKRNKECLYQPLPDSWNGQDVFIFPFVARLVGGTYTCQGKEYEFKNHGLIRYMTGEPKLVEGDIEIHFHSDEETLARYPFAFEAYSKYHLDQNKLVVSYHIQNLSDKEMPFMVGGHPAFKVPTVPMADDIDIKGNYLTLAKKTKLFRITQEETFSFNTGEALFMDTDRIDLSRKLFNDINTIILKGDSFDELTLHEMDGTTVKMNKCGAKYLALWSKSKGDYVAIEPWDGIPDYVNPNKELSQKPGVQVIKPGEKYVFSYEVEIN